MTEVKKHPLESGVKIKSVNPNFLAPTTNICSVLDSGKFGTSVRRSGGDRGTMSGRWASPCQSAGEAVTAARNGVYQLKGLENYLSTLRYQRRNLRNTESGRVGRVHPPLFTWVCVCESKWLIWSNNIIYLTEVVGHAVVGHRSKMLLPPTTKCLHLIEDWHLSNSSWGSTKVIPYSVQHFSAPIKPLKCCSTVSSQHQTT